MLQMGIFNALLANGALASALSIFKRRYLSASFIGRKKNPGACGRGFLF